MLRRIRVLITSHIKGSKYLLIPTMEHMGAISMLPGDFYVGEIDI